MICFLKVTLLLTINSKKIKTDFKLPNSPRNGKKDSAEDGGLAVVSSQLHIVHIIDLHNTEGEPWNFLMKDVTPGL